MAKRLRNAQSLPRIWSDEELRRDVKRALNEFVDRRLKETDERYSGHLKQKRSAHFRLVRTLSGIDPSKPDPETVRTVLLDGVLLDALRYVAGPPVSADDLAVLVTRTTEKISKARLRSSESLPIDVLKLICRLTDRHRFPWVLANRKPSKHELKAGARATAVLQAAQALQNERRGFGREVEKRLRKRLIELGYKPATAPNGGKIRSPKHWPAAGSFFGECTVYGRKADLLIGLSDERLVAVEAKDSSSALNSVKRVLNDTAAKAKHWKDKAGEHIIPVALLSGVFEVPILVTAQSSGLYIVWAHDIDQFISWLQAQ